MFRSRSRKSRRSVRKSRRRRRSVRKPRRRSVRKSRRRRSVRKPRRSRSVRKSRRSDNGFKDFVKFYSRNRIQPSKEVPKYPEEVPKYPEENDIILRSRRTSKINNKYNESHPLAETPVIQQRRLSKAKINRSFQTSIEKSQDYVNYTKSLHEDLEDEKKRNYEKLKEIEADYELELAFEKLKNEALEKSVKRKS
jgi:hypothetical protein